MIHNEYANIEPITDGHGHTLTIEHFAKKLIPGISKRLGNKFSRETLELILRGIFLFSKKDDLSRLADMLDTAEKTQFDILKEWFAALPKNSTVQVLTIDMAYMGAGEVPTPYEKQIEELITLKKIGFDIKIFIQIDCRRPAYEALIKKYLAHIDGFKVYPTMGTFPYDRRYDTMFAYAKQYNKPIVYHCSTPNINYYRGSDIDKLLKQSHYPLYKHRFTKKQKSYNFNNPLGIIECAEKNPDVMFQVAHMGGIEEIDKHLKGVDSWTTTLLLAALRLPNLMLDISYGFYKPEYHQFLKNLLTHPILRYQILFGTDFYLNKTVADMNAYLSLYNILTEEEWNLITRDNYKRLRKQV
jgi:predicted TIM-barrel fold metal-dependent hydrolase